MVPPRMIIPGFARRTPIGVDVGEDTTRIVQLDARSNRIRAALSIPMIDGASREQFDLGSRIKRSLRRAGFTGTRCVVGVPRNFVHIHSIRAPEMPSKELNESLTWEATERFSIPQEHLRVDGIRTGARAINSDGDRSEVVLFAMDDRNATPCLETLLEAGLAPMALEPSFCGVSRAHSRHCRREEDRERVRVVLDCGAGGCTLVYLRGDRIGFCKTFSVSGDLLDATVAEKLEMDIESAAALRRDRCRASRTKKQIDMAAESGVLDASKPLLHELATEVALCLRHCAVAFRGARPEVLILSGRDASEPGLAEVIAERTGMTVQTEDEDQTISSIDKQLRNLGIRDEEPAAWTAALGLALHPLRARAMRARRAA